MNRTDRLHALSEELRRTGPGGRTAARLASWLEVSTRTIKRHVAALQQGGLPIYAQAGPGGGYVVDEVATMTPVNLTASQAVAVAVAFSTAPDGPYSVDGRAALGKVLDVMDPAARERSEQLASRVWVRTAAAQRTSVVAAVDDALAQRRVLALTYRDRHGVVSRRRVEPQLVARTNDRWYLVGWCLNRQGPRWFRYDRIEAADITTTTVADRDLATFGTPPPDAHPVG